MRTTYEITLESGSAFEKHRSSSPLRIWYTPLRITPQDRAKLSHRQSLMILSDALFPIRKGEFKEILKTLNTNVKYKIRTL